METKRIAFIGNFQVPYTTENDRKWSFEKLGYEVIPLQENTTTAQQIISLAPRVDFLIYSHTHGWKIDLLKEAFFYYKKSGIPTISVHLDRWAGLARELDIGTEATWFTQYQFMADGSPEAVALYTKHHLNWIFLAPGVVERDCYLAEPNITRFPHEIIFVGSRGYHPEYPFRKELIDALKYRYGQRFGHYGGDGTAGATTRGHDLNVLYASAKVVVGDSCFGGRPYYVSDRYYETRGRGGVLIHPHHEGFDTNGVTHYEPQNIQSVFDKIDALLANNEYREEMRTRGFTWVKENETYTNRAQEIIDFLHKEKSI